MIVLLKYSLVLINLVTICYSDGVFDVTEFGADLSGKNTSTDAIKKAIDAAANSGGGVVVFPKGTYLTGAIHLRSNITLDLQEGTELSFSTDFDDYLPMVTVRWEGTVIKSFSPLLYAYQVENIAIRGKGVLQGNGQIWWDKWTELRNIYNENGSRPEKYQEEFLKNNNLSAIAQETEDMSRLNVGFARPTIIHTFESRNIVIEGITLYNSPFWHINPVFSQNITIKNISIYAPYSVTNTDGIDPDSCRDVHISGAIINVGDDGIAVKSGRDLQGRKYGVPSENILIEDVVTLQATSGVAIGSEHSGGVRNVTVRNCFFNGSDKGIFIKSTRGRGGVVEDIQINNITITRSKLMVIHIMMATTKTEPEPFSERTPVFKKIKISDVTGDAQDAATISGLEESLLEEIELNNIDIETVTGVTSEYIKSLKITSYKQG